MLLDQIIAALNFGLFIVMFIGFWTYADYYTKLRIEIRRAYWILHAFLYGFCAIGFMVYADKPEWFKMSVNVSAVIISFVMQLVMIVLSVLFLIVGFIKSREYFGRKRNKL